MLPAEFSVQDDFPPASYEEWRQLAEADLEGASFEQKLVSHTYEGIDVQPVYTRREAPGEGDPTGFPGLSPFIRGSTPLGALQTGWDLRQEHTHPDPQVSNSAILDDLQGGVTSLLLRLDVAARAGLDPDDASGAELAGRDGMMIYHLSDLDQLLKQVHLQMIAVTLEAGAAFQPAAALLVALWKQRGVAFEQARGAFNADPLAVLVRDGQLPTTVERALAQLAELAIWTDKHLPQVTSVRVGSAPYHHAGATAVQDIAFSMATATEYLRALTGAGMSVDAAARQLLFSMSVGTHHFLAIAKLRAARQLWARIVEVSGGSPGAAAMRLHSRISKRVLTLRDPYVNLLRNTVGVFAAGLAGAEAITSVPFDNVAGLPDDFSRRIARNTALILQEEAHLHRVIDPPGGSWYLDWLTSQLAEKSWALFQEIERQGGMVATIQSGWVSQQIDSAFAPRAKNIARRKEGITGVSEFPDVAEAPIQRPAPDRAGLQRAAAERLARTRPASLPSTSADFSGLVAAAQSGASIGQLAQRLHFHTESAQAVPITPHPFAEPFEELREASDQFQEKAGKRPTVFLVNMGSPAHHTARATYAKNFFEAGGFAVIGNNGFKEPDAAVKAFVASRAPLAVLCSSDKLYPDLVPNLAAALKSAGARAVVLAGNPGANEAAWRAAGVDRFIFIKCDVLATLREMLTEEGVLVP